MVSFTYILSQFLAIIYYILFGLTYYMKDKRVILILGIISIFIHSISFILLGGFTAAAMSLVAVFRNILFILEDNKGKENKISLHILYLITVISGIFTYNNIFSLLPILATILYTYSIWQSDVKKYKLLGIVTGILYLIYNLYLRSIFGILMEFILTLCSFIGFMCGNKK